MAYFQPYSRLAAVLFTCNNFDSFFKTSEEITNNVESSKSMK